MTFKNLKAFTLVELSIGLVFITFLIIAIATTTIQVGNTYNYGLSIKAVGEAGRSVISDIQQESRKIKPFDSDSNDFQFIDDNSGHTGGRLCLGTFSYIWNYAQAIKNNSLGSNVYESSNDVIRFVKVQDTNKAYCQDAGTKIDKSKSKELLVAGDKNLALYSFDITSPSSNIDLSSGTRMYYFEFYLGTENPDPITQDAGKYRCKNPDESGSNLTYCVVELFSISVLSGI